MSTQEFVDRKVVALAGGVGGAKLAAGLQAILPPGNLTVIVNTGDDFEHWGLTICPDMDTVLYNLAGVNNPETGWGRWQENFTTLAAMSQLGAEDWFRLGDKDLAVHLRRSEWLRQGYALSEVAERLRMSFGVQSKLLPMCDEAVRTLVHTDEGDLPFQHYFVRRHCEPIVVDLTYVGAAEATLNEAVQMAVEDADFIVFCPSNPFLSIDPILSVPGLRRLIRKCRAPKVAVSPIVGGQAIKGPAGKMLSELGRSVSATAIAEHYAGLITGFVVDQQDAALSFEPSIALHFADTIMTDLASRARLAKEVLAFAEELTGVLSVS